jgi:uncharacterized protein (TIGR02145 family)
MATENKGVIYYKLDPDYHYEGDYTKNCGLSGGEIDGNFHFLRGYDISSFDMSENKEELVITRFNGEKMSFNIKDKFPSYDFDYNKSTGVLKITMPYGETIELNDFLTDNSFKVHGDFTINGDGTRYNPLTVSSLAKTGTYRPAKQLLDLVSEDSKDSLPTANISFHERYVTKEKVSKYGLLYPLHGVDEIQKRLQEIGSEWRVPTKEDWDNLLNVIEKCDADRTHDNDTTNKFLGVNAGAYLKSNDQWKPYYRKLENGEIVLDGERFIKDEKGNFIPNEDGDYLKVINSEDKYGFSIYPTGFGGRRGKESIGGFGEWAAFWSSSEEDRNKDMYVKVFSYDERAVEQNTWGRDCYLSIRLVKDYTGNNLYDVETIDGNNVATKLISVENNEDREKFSTTLIWTTENIGFSNPQYGGVVSPEWPNVEGTSFELRYYINDWDGTKWLKNEIQEGESVVLLSENGVDMHEWRLVNGVLVDTLDIIKGEFQEEFQRLDEIEAALENEKNERMAADAELRNDIEDIKDKLTEEIFNRIEGDAALETKINEILSEISEIETALEAERFAREEADLELQRQIDEAKDDIEELGRTDAELQKQINENKVEGDSSVVVEGGYTDENGVSHKTVVKVRLPENGMIKVDEEGLYFDGNYNLDGDFKIDNNTNE